MRRLVPIVAALAVGGATLVSGISAGATVKPPPLHGLAVPAPRLVMPHGLAVPAPRLVVPPGLLKRMTPFGVPRPLVPRSPIPLPFRPRSFVVPHLVLPPSTSCYVASTQCSVHPCTEFVSPRATPVPSVTLAAPLGRAQCRPSLGRVEPVGAVVIGASTLAPVGLHIATPAAVPAR